MIKNVDNSNVDSELLNELPVDKTIPTPYYDGLIPRFKLFVDLYTGPYNLNGTATARKLGYANPGVSSSQIVNNPVVAKAIAEKIQVKMSANEVLSRLTMLAAFDPNDVYSVNPDGTLYIDANKLKQPHVLYALKKYSKLLNGQINIEFEDRVAALQLLGKHYKLFSDVVTMGVLGDGTEKTLTDAELIEIAKQGLAPDEE